MVSRRSPYMVCTPKRNAYFHDGVCVACESSESKRAHVNNAYGRVRTGQAVQLVALQAQILAWEEYLHLKQGMYT
jgi:hypothetical protein